VGKKKSILPEQQLDRLVWVLQVEYDRWQFLHDHGGSDPLWPDGYSMESIRKHITYTKNNIKILCEETGLPLPEEFSRPVPPEVPRDYMARPDEIRAHARKALDLYLANPDYQYLMQFGPLASKEAQERACFTQVVECVRRLQVAIAEDSLVEMRLHERCDWYLNRIRKCAECLRGEAREAEHRDGQLSWFQRKEGQT